MGAWTAYLILTGVSSFSFALVFTVNLLYQVQTVRLSPLQLVLVGTMLEAVIVAGEVPTGVVADLMGRRRSITIGLGLTGVGFIVEGLFPVFAAILLAQVLWGIGITFASGAQEAWVADELGVERAGAAYLRGGQVGRVGGLLGLGASVALGRLRLNLPIVSGGILFILLACVLLVAMPERGFRPVLRERRSTRMAMSETLGEGVRLVRGRPALIAILVAGVVAGAASEGFDRLWTVHLLRDVGLPVVGSLSPVIWIGGINAGSMLLGIGAAELLRRRIDLSSSRAVALTLLGIQAGIVLGVIGFGVAASFPVALATLWLVVLLRDLADPLTATWIGQQIGAASGVRATVMSLSNQLNAFGQLAGGPGVGAVGNRSVRAALVLSGLLLAPAVPLVGWAAASSEHPEAGVDGGVQ